MVRGLDRGGLVNELGATLGLGPASVRSRFGAGATVDCSGPGQGCSDSGHTSVDVSALANRTVWTIVEGSDPPAIPLDRTDGRTTPAVEAADSRVKPAISI